MPEAMPQPANRPRRVDGTPAKREKRVPKLAAM
jgi:hypothetical protein